MRVQLVISSSLLALSACYTSSFQASGTAPDWYQPTHRDAATVKLLTVQPDPDLYVEVGLVSASGAGTDGAIARAKEEAAYQGCDALFLLGEAVESGSGTPGSAYGMTRNHLRASCLVAIPEAKRKAKPVAAAATSASTEACVPACRMAFVCVKAVCVSACNPPCGPGQQCVVEPGGPNCVPAAPAP